MTVVFWGLSSRSLLTITLKRVWRAHHASRAYGFCCFELCLQGAEIAVHIMVSYTAAEYDVRIESDIDTCRRQVLLM